MCCCNCPCFYKGRMPLLITLTLFEGIFGLIRGVVFIAIPTSAGTLNNHTNIINTTDRLTTAFILDVASSLTATLVIILIVLAILIPLFIIALIASGGILVCCCIACCMDSEIRSFCPSLSRRNFQALYRILSADCNCPCYRARPKFRFSVRVIFTLSCAVLRGIAIYLYWSISSMN